MIEEPIRKTLEDPSRMFTKENFFGFYDWFCTTESLERRAKALFNKFKRIAKSSKINLDTSYLWFKNNCPMVGNVYDDFRISDLATGDVLYTVVPKTGHKTGQHVKDGLYAEVWGFKGEPRQTELHLPTYKDVVAWFMAENSLIDTIPDEDIPLHINGVSISIEGRRVLTERLKK